MNMNSNSDIDNTHENDYHGSGNPGTEGAAVDRLLTVQEICELLKVKKTYVYWLTHRNRIPHIKIQGSSGSDSQP
jgi:excisionase family DNA binding protein